ITHDSYDGANLQYSYEHIAEFWQHFNYTYIVLYDTAREEELMQLLGDDADEMQNLVNAFELARQEAIADQADSFAWFNMGTVLVELGKLLDDPEMFEQAATAYD